MLLLVQKPALTVFKAADMSINTTLSMPEISRWDIIVCMSIKAIYMKIEMD